MLHYPQDSCLLIEMPAREKSIFIGFFLRSRLWDFVLIPAIILPGLMSIYPCQHQQILRQRLAIKPSLLLGMLFLRRGLLLLFGWRGVVMEEKHLTVWIVVQL